MRLDVYVATYFPEYSRAVWQKYITLGLVSVNGEVITAFAYELDEDDEVSVELPAEVKIEEVDIPILYEDEDVIVINKPSGILTHAKGALLEEFTVADFMRPFVLDDQTSNRPGIVHRLDRDTSGVLICAKHADAKHFLQKQFQDRKAKKKYLALVSGTPKNDEAIIRLPIGRNPKKPQTFSVHPSGKSAETSYRTLDTTGKYSLIELKPLTGRTHQLRVHLRYINCPIVGDALYGTAKSNSRLMLHAAELEITLPNRERQTFAAPVPEDFANKIIELELSAVR
jgi:23S rRNA pseudouridine1911/1915/1917 synthase